MRAVLVLVAALMLGLAGGYAWSSLTPAQAHVRVPKVPKARPIVIPESVEDEQWSTRAEQPDGAAQQSVHYSGCNEVRAAGKAPLHEGEPGYRAEMDGDGDGIACEPHPAG
jgi:hypothetical protein